MKTDRLWMDDVSYSIVWRVSVSVCVWERFSVYESDFLVKVAIKLFSKHINLCPHYVLVLVRWTQPRSGIRCRNTQSLNPITRLVHVGCVENKISSHLSWKQSLSSHLLLHNTRGLCNDFVVWILVHLLLYCQLFWHPQYSILLPLN